MELYMLQASGDMEDIVTIVTKDAKGRSVPRSNDWHDVHHHCTGLVMMPKTFDDVWFSQDSWSAYNTLNRMLKDYEVLLGDKSAVAHRWTFSSTAGVMLSLDDLWVLDSGLVVLETTVHTWNSTLYDLYCRPKSVLSWIRVQVANTLAINGESWIEYFNRENSYTYNNQYFVLNLAKFLSARKPLPGLLWTVEQVPGHVVSGDRTEQLATAGWVPSINTPFFKEVYEASGYPQQVIATGCDYWSYENCSRHLIMKRDCPGITSYSQFQKFMRYNDWKNDPLSNGDAAQQILSRYDLRPAGCIEFGKMKWCPHPFGGLDSKTTRVELARNGLRFDAISSPQYETQPAFSFDASIPHAGLPEGPWRFPWIQFGVN